MGRPFDAGQDLDAIGRDHDQARIGGRVFFGVFQDETAEGDDRGGPVFRTAARHIFDADLSRDEKQQTQITIRGTVLLLLSPV